MTDNELRETTVAGNEEWQGMMNGGEWEQQMMGNRTNQEWGTTNMGMINSRDDEHGDDEHGDDEQQGWQMAGTTQWPHPRYKREMVGRFFFSNSIFFFLILLAIPHHCEHLSQGVLLNSFIYYIIEFI